MNQAGSSETMKMAKPKLRHTLSHRSEGGLASDFFFTGHPPSPIASLCWLRRVRPKLSVGGLASD